MTIDQTKPLIVGIDAGHGGPDDGAKVDGLTERTYNLRMAQRLQLSVANNTGAKPVLLRRDDYKMSLTSRAVLAIQMRCDAIISIHVNAAKDPRLHGALGFYMPGDDIGRTMCDAILRMMPLPLLRYGDAARAATDNDGTGDDWLQRPRAVMKPYGGKVCCLIELGYCTNDRDLAALLSRATQGAIVHALTGGVWRLLQEVEAASGTGVDVD